MSDRLSEPPGAPQPAEPPPTSTPTRPGRRPALRAGLLQSLMALVLFAALSAVAAVVWEWLWTPPVGVVVDHHWLATNEQGLRGEFSGTGWFVVVATVTGLVAGGLAAAFLDRVPLLTLLAVVGGSVLGTWVMLRLGPALGPPDPTSLGAHAGRSARLPDRLEVSGASAWVAMPAGALIALALVFIGLAARFRPGGRPRD